MSDSEKADIVVGILCKNVEATILHVMNVVNDGLHRYFSEHKKAMVVSDGYSSDRTKELAELFQPYEGVKKIITYDRERGGKGGGVKTVLAIAQQMDAKVVILLDGDLLSIRPEWIYELAAPILYGRADLMVPYYIRDKYDGVITNNLVYPFTRALYGIDIRQPIAGEYGLSKKLYEMLLSHPLFPLDFGVDIFIVTSAAASRMRIMEGIFSLKIHESTTHYLEPEELLLPMFRQVTGTMFKLAEYYEDFWRNNGSIFHHNTVNEFNGKKPVPVRIDMERMRNSFREEFLRWQGIIKKILPEGIMKRLGDMDGGTIKNLDSGTWAEIVYNFAAAYKKAEEKEKILDALKSLWLGRFLSYAMETEKMDLMDAERLIQEQARIFEEKREYLLSIY
ncbi:MAG: glycosyltransferase [Thermoplasmata archaeon]|nr:glycosyltransferase [Thermoplasmata archaeon]